MKGRVKYQIFLLIVFAAVWIWAAINPIYTHDWLLENYLVFIFVPVILISAWDFKLSNVSYTLLTAFMCLHVIGSHYTYAEVPFGYILQDWFNADRNMYDRVVHFSFGFLLAYPIREVFMRISKAKGFWAFWFPIELTFAFSAIYEVIEWLTVLSVDPSAGLAFLGAQGDVWDAQKDMLLAGIGAVIAMVVTGFIRARYDKNFWSEFRESFKIPQNDAPLGEVAIAKLKRITTKIS